MLLLNGISKNYGDYQALKEVNLRVNKKDIYGLIGQNGAGKTTIFKIILGLSKYDSGTISLEESKTNKELNEKRKNIGFFIGNNFFDDLNARDNLKYYCTLKKISSVDEVNRVLKIVGLENVEKSFKSFSMGMKQRLGIANALLGNPRLLILDEPTNGLDPQGILDIRNLIKELNNTYDMTIIVSSHILDELEHTANRFGILHNGKLMKEISYEELQLKKNTVEIKVDDLTKAKNILKENGIGVSEGKSNILEEYYFDLIKEKSND